MRAHCDSLDAALAEATAEVEHVRKRNATLAQQLKRADSALIQHLANTAAEDPSKRSRKSAFNASPAAQPDADDPTGKARDEESASALRDLRRQLKRSAARNMDLDMQLHALREEVLMYKGSKEWLEDRKRAKANANTVPSSSDESFGVQPDLMMSLIRELTSANGKLAKEVQETRDLLEKSQTEVLQMQSQMEEWQMGHPELSSHSLAQEMVASSSFVHEHGFHGHLTAKSLAPDSDVEDSFETDSTTSPVPPHQAIKATAAIPLPTSPPRPQPTKDIIQANMYGTSPASSASGRLTRQSSFSHTTTQMLMTSLHAMTLSLHARLSATDTVAINRESIRISTGPNQNTISTNGSKKAASDAHSTSPNSPVLAIASSPILKATSTTSPHAFPLPRLSGERLSTTKRAPSSSQACISSKPCSETYSRRNAPSTTSRSRTTKSLRSRPPRTRPRIAPPARHLG
ncbi:hypothetical protein BC830DRAFT_1154551 [Chytriomyces sp. MP71]|nr:hypothetical protein BC830DRAFT_1154551 [Chytriomyces sp. MP71]